MIPNEEMTKLGKRSQISGLLSFLSLVLILSAIGFSYYQLTKINEELDLKKIELVEVENQIKQIKANRIISETHTNLGKTYARRKTNLDENRRLARKEYEIALNADSLNLEAYEYLGYIYYRQQEYDRAIATYKSLLNHDSKYAWGWYNLALAYWAKSDTSNTVNCVKNIVELDKYVTEVVRKENQFRKIRRLKSVKVLLRYD